MCTSMICLQVSMRPSIDSILADSVVQRKQDSFNRKKNNNQKLKETPPSSGGRLSGSGDKDVPANGQDLLTAKMRQLALKEKELETLELLEKCSCENSYVTTEAAPRVGRLSPSSDDTDSLSVALPSCLLSGKSKDSPSPKKHVTFYNVLNGKENQRRKPGSVLQHVPQPYKFKSTETSMTSEGRACDFLFRNPLITGLSGLGGREIRTKYTRRDFGLLNFR
ncbi:hypothetical protein ElyMa_004249800 [Elysia marginata]|uniref:Uncharacterized protein n=1 Tax=Elysia marginata TaxID=1093978 RepID=A0AAV4GR44_9GAST|nr:hypothetical protein ElyMa_004249800 [Elysia marginata]